ncbi:MAG: hypothetical protein JOY96_05755, partial [Verrucomicrobia bacterium]|nr:hypothetical protein [Verrucomicrobiota bacterium]
MPFFRWFRSKPKEEKVSESSYSETSKISFAEIFPAPIADVSEANGPMKPGPAQVEMSTENTGTDRVISTEIPAEVHEIAEQSPPFQNVSTAASPASVADIIELEPDCREVEAAPEHSDVDRQRVFIPLGSLLSQLKPDKSKNYSQTEANITIPLFLIRPQLASGKILLSLKEFAGQLSPELNLAGLD